MDDQEDGLAGERRAGGFSGRRGVRAGHLRSGHNQARGLPRHVVRKGALGISMIASFIAGLL